MCEGLLPDTDPATVGPVDASQESHTPSAARVLPVGQAETAHPASSSRSGGVRTLYLPWPPKALSPNIRTNRRVKAIFIKQYRKAVAEAAWSAGFTPMREPALRLARVLFQPTNARWDQDNCIAAFKAGQDGLADALGANDRTFRPVWDMGPPVKGGEVICEFDEIPA